MTVLIIGVVLWSSVHLFPAIARPARGRLIEKLGEKAYKGLFALLIVASLVLIVTGWQSVPETVLYTFAPWTRTVAVVLIAIAFLLIGASLHPTRIKRYIRHPMLTGVIVWGASHLLANGTTRALVLFGGLALWAIVEILLINRRVGLYVKPDRPDLSEELRGFFISGIFLLIVLYLHPLYTGVAALPR